MTQATMEVESSILDLLAREGELMTTHRIMCELVIVGRGKFRLSEIRSALTDLHLKEAIERVQWDVAFSWRLT